MATAKTLAVIRIRGEVNVPDALEQAMQEMHLHRKHFCAVVPSNPSFVGMIKKVEDYVTWGEIDDATQKELEKKRGEEYKDKEGKAHLKPFFRLAPPRKGFERKGTKKSFHEGGALGYRGEKINDLIKRMI